MVRSAAHTAPADDALSCPSVGYQLRLSLALCRCLMTLRRKIYWRNTRSPWSSSVPANVPTNCCCCCCCHLVYVAHSLSLRIYFILFATFNAAVYPLPWLLLSDSNHCLHWTSSHPAQATFALSAFETLRDCRLTSGFTSISYLYIHLQRSCASSSFRDFSVFVPTPRASALLAPPALPPVLAHVASSALLAPPALPPVLTDTASSALLAPTALPRLPVSSALAAALDYFR